MAFSLKLGVGTLFGMHALNVTGRVGMVMERSLILCSVHTRGVNRSPKISELRKCPNTIRTLVGHPIFSWTSFGQAISCRKFHAFHDLIGLWSANQ